MTASIPARCNTSWATATSCTRCDIRSCAPTASTDSGRTDGIDALGSPAKSILWIAAIPLAETLAASPRANCESWRAIGAWHSVSAASALDRGECEDLPSAMELLYLSPHPHQARSNVDRGARLPGYLNRTICLVPPIPRCERI